MAMKKVYSETFERGLHDDDALYHIIRELNSVSSKPLFEHDETDDMSYYTLLHKKVKMILYVEDENE